VKAEPLLKDFLIVELASVLAGPAVGMFFAELGARVIKVENPRSAGDLTRTWKLPEEDPDTDISTYFSCVNWGKESISLDLSQDDGRAQLYSLIENADVVISSYRVGDDVALKVDYQTLRKINPLLIYAHVTAYGTQSSEPGFDAAIQAEAGFIYMNGEPGGVPVKMPVALMDLLTAHQLKEGILLALLKREREGEGAYVTASLFQSGVASLANQATNWLIAGKVPERAGSEHPNIAPYGSLYYCSDGKPFVLAVGSDRQFKNLCQACNMPEVASDQRFSTNFNRVQNRVDLRKILEVAFARLPRSELLERLQRSEVPAASVNNMQEVFSRPDSIDLLLRGQQDDRALMGVRSVVFSVSDSPPAAQLSPPPHLNEHGHLIRSEFPAHLLED
jgi:crotonobetainyl-CoA:carnitine CoA-transferase CaiB-like acyl-CoA transferase